MTSSAQTIDPPGAQPPRRVSRLPLHVFAIAAWAGAMSPLLFWGLPSSRHDNLLFGGEPPWPAERYRLDPDLQRLRERQAGADTDLNPLAARDRVVDLTPDDAARAEILRRYRLFSRQPDEMITLRALQRMQPRQLDFDPRLYQYGGGYIYLVGAALGAAAKTGLLSLKNDPGDYLAHPEAFARFYVVARAVSLIFGAFTLLAVYRLAQRAGGPAAGWLALLLAAITPVFITGILEAKPHLPSACMLLWAINTALDYRKAPHLRTALKLGLQAGYAFGLVLTGIVAVLLWPALWLAGRRPAPAAAPPVNAATAADSPPLPHARPQRAAPVALPLLLAVLVFAAVYVLTNPYVAYNLLFRRAVLASNISNSTAMYEDQAARAVAGALRVGELLVEAAGPGLLVLGVVGALVLGRRHPRGLLLPASVGLGTLLIAVLTGAGKPAEFGRFLVVPVLLLVAAAAPLLASGLRTRRTVVPSIVFLILIAITTNTRGYLASFAIDAAGNTESRHLAALYLREHAEPGEPIGLLQEPAPYAVPPLDFAHGRFLLLPPAAPPDLDERQLPPRLVFTADHLAVHAHAWWQPYYRLEKRFPPSPAGESPIAWANKPVFIYQRHE